MAEGFVPLLEGVLGAVARDAPRCADRARRALDGLAIELRVDGERARLEVDRACWTLRSPAPGDRPADVDVDTSGQAIARIVEGGLELLPALETNALVVRADAARAACLFDAFASLVEGCVRSPEGPDLLRRLRHLPGNQGIRS